MSVIIEPAKPEDIPRLVELLNNLFGIELDFTADATRQVRGLEMLMSEAAKYDRQTIAVARNDAGIPVGMATAQLIVSTAEGALSAWIEDVIVHPEHRRQGIGSMLIGNLLEWAKARGATRAQLVADQENESADFFYASLSWRSTQLIVRRQSIRQHE